ncbi:MAG TPA: N-acetyl-gamma-glutamyl-phosphate reductase [Acidimicrobiales bacterium]|nr:N-acetyl-gamma-glutamyl-phosphate reductase [Acidimicrobiales bacterium]
MRAGIVGATGYLGAELLRLLAGHPNLEVAAVQADSSAGKLLWTLYPGLRAPYGDLVVGGYDLDALLSCDVVFVALPSGVSQQVIPDLVGKVKLVVDLGADFRLKDALLYEQWYGFTHQHPGLLAASTYGLVEVYREALRTASFIASPGCYVTAASIGLAPLVKAGLIEPSGVIIDGASGTSGAGKDPQPSTHHSQVNENYVAYAVTTHRHTPEIEQASGAKVLFTPHLLPMTRGILATMYVRPIGRTSTEEILDFYRVTYSKDQFVCVTDGFPATRDTYGSNNVHIGARFDSRSGTVILFSALDNLTKGGSGQAIQAANVALGFDEGAGLPKVALLP